jgi:Gpi18-like mannosyltransferase
MKKKLCFLSALLLVFIFFDWFVSSQARALRIDRNILYSVDDIFRFCYLKASFYHPVIFLNPNLKILSMMISRLFFALLPAGMLSLRIMSSIFSVATIAFLYKVTRLVNPGAKLPVLPVLFTLTSAVYLLVSVSTLAESMFAFFLIAALYLFYSRRYLFSALMVSLLPAIRQEGLFFMAAWAIVLARQKGWRYLFVLPVPFFLWSLANVVFLGHSPIYTVLYFKHLSPNTPTSVLMLPREFNMSIIYFSLPAIALFAAGLFRERRNKNYLLIFLCVFFHLGFLTLSSAIKLFKTGYLSYVIRLITPSIPLVSMYMGSGFEILAQKFLRKKRWLAFTAVLVFLFSAGLMLGRLQAFQKVPVVDSDSVDERQIAVLKEAGLWLDGYMRINGIDNIHALGSSATDRFIRRVWMELSGRVKYYTIVEWKILLDMFTFKRLPIPDEPAVFICLNEKDFDYPDSFRKTRLRVYPEVSLEFYLLEPRRGGLKE